MSVVNVVCCEVEVSVAADHLSRGVLPSVMEKLHGGLGPLGAVEPRIDETRNVRKT